MRSYLYRDLGECFYSPIQFKRVLDPAIVSAIIGAGASIASSAGSSIAAANLNATNRDFSREMTLKQNEFNAEQAALSREHQAGLLSQEQNWQEQMYNLYNSPSAMMRQYREAGMNPYMVDSQGIHGQSLGTPSAPGSPQASGASVVSPSTYMPDLSGIGRSGEMLLQGISVSANSANQSAQGIHQVLENAVMMEKMDIPKDRIENYMYSAFKEIKGANFDASRFVQEYDLKIESERLAKDMSALQLSIEREFGRTERSDKIMNMEQQFSVMAAEIGRMAVQNKFDEAAIDRMASEIARNFAAAGLDAANSDLIRGSMEYLINSAQYQARLDWFNQATAEGEYNLRKPVYDASSTDVGQTVEVVDYYTGKIVDKASKLMKINIGVNRSRSTSSSRNYTNSWIWNGRDYTP